MWENCSIIATHRISKIGAGAASNLNIFGSGLDVGRIGQEIQGMTNSNLNRISSKFIPYK